MPKIVGLIVLLYGVFCFVFNFLGLFLTGIPNLGDVGSWIFNPLGMAFANPVSSYLMGNLGGGVLWLFGDLFANGAAWAIGGLFGVIWTLIMIFVGFMLVRR